MPSVHVALFFALLLSPVLGYVEVNSSMRSFSSAIKGGYLNSNEETTLYMHNTGQPGVVTEQWFTGNGVMDENARIRIYVDDEVIPSIDFMLLLAHGIGFTETDEAPNIPWGTRRMAHAAKGGIYNTFRIPFEKNVKVTATHPSGGHFWYIIRGVENYPLIMGDLLLPKTAKLKLFKQEGASMDPLSFLPLANVRDSGGAVFLVTLAASSNDLTYLEGCMRISIDGDLPMFLSSGTEDFFLSAYYFDAGIYHFSDSGCTYKSGGSMSAYKFFENDPLLFSKSLELIWRAGETANGPDGCPNSYPFPTSPQTTGAILTKEGKYMDIGAFKNVTVTTYTWVYVWPN